MRIKAEQLVGSMKKKLLPIYLMSSDEPILLLEAEDCIREYAKAKGFFEREIFDIDGRFQWRDFSLALESRSLFAEQRIIELRFQNKPDLTAQKILQDYAKHIDQSILMILRMPKLDQASLKSKWLQALDSQAGIVILLPPLAHELPQWIAQRAHAQGVKLLPDAIQYLSQHDEGNLLAITQEISQLQLIYGDEPVNLSTLCAVMEDNARFKAFDLADAVLAGNIVRLKRMIDTLKQEGEEPVLINWVLQKEIRTLSKLILQYADGEQIEQILSGIWEKRKPLYRAALKRLKPLHVERLMQCVIEIDYAIKGQSKDNPWNAIFRLSFALSGKAFLPLSSLPQA